MSQMLQRSLIMVLSAVEALLFVSCGGDALMGSSPGYVASETADDGGVDTQVADVQGADIADAQAHDAQVTDTQVTDTQVTDAQVTDIEGTDSPVADTAGCESTCALEGSTRCEQGQVQTCVSESGCLQWSQGSSCPEGLVCSDGECVEICPGSECTVIGATKCDGNAVRTCGDYDQDGCLEWGTADPCEPGETCSNGACAETCSGECTVEGATKCDGDAVQTCGDYDQDECLEWGTAVSCDAGETCSNGVCAVTCSSECTTGGATKCDGDAVQTCGDYDQDGCLEWGTAVPCAVDELCSNGACAASCSSECTVIGATKCDGNGVRTCGDYDQDECLEWGTAVPCGTNELCSNGACAAVCSSECTVDGATKCDGTAVQICGDYNQDGCLEWGSSTPCPAGMSCSNGLCSVVCEDECVATGDLQCDGDAVQTCGDHDGDECLEWSTPVACAADEQCSLGVCSLLCDEECTTEGDQACFGVGYKVCGDADGDGCNEWGTLVACAACESCQGGSCIVTEPPATVVISEVLYDAVGADKDVFVELHGPPGTAMDGFTLTGVNGNGGVMYNQIALSGAIPASGFFVIAHSEATGDIAAVADLLDDDVDYQNGPDSIQLLWCDEVVDAVGYGVFDDAVFGGEGAPAVDVVEGHSLSRDIALTDTDNNAADFTDTGLATPGGDVAPGSSLVINEVFYDQVDTDGPGAFIELWGSAYLSLDGYSLQAINGSGGVVYATLQLDGYSLNADGYFLVAHPDSDQGLLDVAQVVDSIADLQNGPDALALVGPFGTKDMLAYGLGGDVPGEGEPALDAPAGQSLSRDAQHTDTNDNLADFSITDPSPMGCTPQCAGKECGDDGCGGQCPSSCDPSQVCLSGDVCGCVDGLTDCGGQCVDLMTDEDNCDACGSPCPDSSTFGNIVYCDQGVCKDVCNFYTWNFTGCSPDYPDECWNLKSDLENCGSCGNDCNETGISPATCFMGMCVFDNQEYTTTAYGGTYSTIWNTHTVYWYFELEQEETIRVTVSCADNYYSSSANVLVTLFKLVVDETGAFYEVVDYATQLMTCNETDFLYTYQILFAYDMPAGGYMVRQEYSSPVPDVSYITVD